MTYESIDALVRQFLDRSLRAQDWTHSTHIAVGAWHVHQHGPEEALKRLRHGIRALNQAHGTPNTEGRGYHETITVAYVRLLDEALKSLHAVNSFHTQVQVILNSSLCENRFLLRFWSHDLLMSAQARAEWVPPDISPLALPPAWRCPS